MGKDIFEQVWQCVNEMNLPWDKLTALTTDQVPAMCGAKNGLVGRMRMNVQQLKYAGDLTDYHIIHQETLCGKALKMKRNNNNRRNKHQSASG